MNDRMLWVFGGGIGDFLLACPALGRLGAAERIDLVGPLERMQLGVAGGLAARAFTFELIDFHSAFSDPSARLRDFLREHERVIVWLGNDPPLVERLRAVGVPRVETHPGRPPVAWAKHASAFYAEELGFDTVEPLRLAIAPGEMRFDVVIHPGSGSASKNVPLSTFRSLAHALESKGYTVAWSLGPAEYEAGLERELPSDARLLPEQSLLERARVLAGASLYIGNDSGITHLAAALGVRTLALFRATEPGMWAPLGVHVEVVSGPEALDAGGLAVRALALVSG